MTGVQTCARSEDRKSTRLNSSHTIISYAVFCLKKKPLTARQHAPARLVNFGARVVLRASARETAAAGPVSGGARGGVVGGARVVFFFNDTATTEIYALSLHDALPI